MMKLDWSPLREVDNDGNPIRGFTRERLRYWRALRGHVATEYVNPSGRRSLKTILHSRFIAGEVMHGTGPERYLIGAPTQAHVKRLYWNRMKSLIPGGLIRRAWDSDLHIEMVSGVELWLAGMDAMNRVEGTPWNGILLDECADISGDKIQAHILPMLPERGAYLIRSGTPDMNGIGQEAYEEAHKRALRGPERDKEIARYLAGKRGKIPVVEFGWPSREVMPEADILRTAHAMSREVYRQEYEGEFVRPANAAYSAFVNGTYPSGNVWDDYEFKPRASVLIACDFNYTFMRWSICQADPSVKPFAMRVVASVSIDNANVERTCEQLVIALRELDPSVDWKYARNLWFFGDFSGHQHRAEATATAWETVQEFFPNADINAEPNPFVADRLNTTNGFLCNARGERRLTVHSQCVELIEDFEKVTREMVLFKKQTAGRLTHASDGIGYLLTSYYHI